MKTLLLLCAFVVLGLTLPGGLNAQEKCLVNNCETCKTLTGSVTCQACKENYVATADKKCLECPSNCKTCEVSGTKAVCKACKDSFFLVNNTCNTCNEGCKNCDKRNECKAGGCEPGFLNAKVQTCKGCPSNCDKCDGAGKCRVCNGEYYLDSVFQCPACPSGCKLCTKAASCDKCKDRKVWNSKTSICDDCPGNCVTCSNKDTCTKCDSTYYLKAGKCVACLNCYNNTKCVTNTGCPTCATGYFKNKDDNKCLDCPFNEMDGSSTRCQSCKSTTKGLGGRFLNGSVCDFCPPDCKSCSSPTQCDVCNDGYYKTSGSCSACHTSCLTCSGSLSTNCLTCPKSNQYLTSTKTCQDCDANCATCSSSATGCTSCPSAKYLDTTCKDCSTTSLDSLDSLQCTSCRGNYVYQEKCTECADNCTACEEDGTSCTACKAGYYLENKQCKACDTSCVTCNGAGSNKCTSCNTTNELIGTACMAKCEDYQYRDSNNACQNCSISNCVKCADATTCTECDATTHISGNQTLCLDCTAPATEADCIAGCYWNGTVCSACNESCKACTDNNSNNETEANECTSCVSGYFLVSSACTSACDASCATCNGPNSDNCTSCGDKKRLNGSTCISCSDSDCKKCSSDVAVCEECLNNKVVVNDSCHACPSGSANAYSGEFCNACMFKNGGNTRYGVAHPKSCTQCDPNCKKCTTNKAGKCDVNMCNSDYVYVSSSKTCKKVDCNNPADVTECETVCGSDKGVYKHWKSPSTCTTCPKHCTGCDDNNKCTSCENEYVLNKDDECVPCYGDSAMCATCGTTTRARVYTVTGKKCQSCIDYCLNCADTTTCNVGKCYGARYYDSVNKECKGCKTGCTKCTENNKKEECIDCVTSSYFKAANKTCYGCIDNCITCADATSCSLCSGLRYYNSTTKKCEDCTDQTNCLQCQNDGKGVCTICKSGFGLTGEKKCSPCPSGCATCGKNTACGATECKVCDTCTSTGNYKDATTGECKACDDSNCGNCSKSTDGKVCNEDGCNLKFYFHASEKKCKACSTNCLKCVSDTKCTSCEAGNCLHTDPDDKNKKTCKSTTDNCETCTTVDKKLVCVTCNAKKALEICEKCDVANCVDCKADKTKCAKNKCRASYYYTGTSNQCSLCADNTDTGDECKVRCDGLTSRFWDSTKKRCDVCKDEKCVTCNPKETCTKCRDGYYLKDKACKVCKDNCAKCTTATDCKNCNDGYRKGGNDTCTKCEISDCSKCDADVKKCEKCKPGYYKKKDGTCASCTDVTADCVSCSDVDGLCRKCQLGYHLKGTKCSQCSETGCGVCKDLPQECMKCKSPYSSVTDPTKCQRECYTCTNCGETELKGSHLKACSADSNHCELKKNGAQFNRGCVSSCSSDSKGCDNGACCKGAKCNNQECSSAPGVRVALVGLLFGLLTALLTK